MSRWLSKLAELNKHDQPVHRVYAAVRRDSKRKPPGPTAKARRRKRRSLSADERREKQKVRDRDRVCRFPRCGCSKSRDPLKRVLTVSHDFHKGMGGDPTGGVSIAPLMVALCKWRHQDAPVSRHAKTLRSVYLTPDQNDGPLAWEVDLGAVYPGQYRLGTWFEVGREDYVEGGSGELRLFGPWGGNLTDEQERVLNELAEMIR